MWVSIYLTCLLSTDSVLCIVLDDWTEYKAQFNGVGNEVFHFLFGNYMDFPQRILYREVKGDHTMEGVI